MASSLLRNMVIRFQGNTEDVEQKADALGDKLKAAGAVAGAAGGAAIAAGLAEAMNADAANAKLAAQLGATGKMAEDLGKVAGNLYSNAYGESLEQVNQAIRGVIQSGLVMEDASNAQLESITAKVLDLSTAFDQDLGGATEAVGQLMKTGLAPNAEAALDVVTRGFQEGADRSGDFLDTLTEYSVQFEKFGLDAASATGILVQGMQAGARNSDLVADAIKEFSIRAIDGSKLTSEGFRAVGLDAADMAAKIGRGGPESAAALDTVLDRLRAMPDPVARSQAAVALFGTQAEDLGDALFALDPSQAVQRLGEVGGATERMGQALNDTAATDMEMFKRQAMGIASDFGAALLPAFREAGPVLQGLGQAIGAVTTFLADNWNWIKYVVAAIAGPLGFIAVLVMAYKESEVFRDIVNGAFHAVKTVVETVVGVVTTVLNALITAYHAVADAVNFLWNVVTTAWNAMLAAINAVWVALEATFNALNAAYQFMGDKVMWLWNAVVVPAWDGIRMAVDASWLAMQVIYEALKAGIQFVGDKFMWLWNNIVNPAWNGMSGTINAVWTNGISPAFELVKDGVQAVGDMFSTVVDGIQTVWNKLTSIMAKPINFFIVRVWNEGIVRKAWNSIAKWIPGIPTLGELDPVPEHFAKGGKVPGFGSKDTVPALLTPGEFVVRKPIAEKATRFLAALNAGQSEAWQAAGGPHARGPQRFATGGVVEGLNFARAQHGKPYIWGGVGPRGYDCSGFMSAIANALLGRYPHSRIGTTGSAPWPGWVNGLTSAFGVGFFKGNPGHMAGTLDGHNVESGGSPSMTKFVQNAAGARHGQFRGHMSLPQVGGQFVGGGGGGGGGFFDVFGKIMEAFNPVRAMIDPGIDALLPGSGPYKDLAKRLPHIVLDKVIDWAKDQAQKLLGFVGNVAGAIGGFLGGDASVRQQVMHVSKQFGTGVDGWGGGEQWRALDRLIQKESSWNPRAQNPRSTAYGLYQFLDSTWATVGGHKTDDPGKQALFGNRYIQNRYGNPVNALAFHNRNNWYREGGWVGGKGPKLIMAHGGEYVLKSDEAQALQSGDIRSGSTVINIASLHMPRDTTPEQLARHITREVRIERLRAK